MQKVSIKYGSPRHLANRVPKLLENLSGRLQYASGGTAGLAQNARAKAIAEEALERAETLAQG